MEIKVTQLKMAMMKTNAVLEKGKHEAIERHLSTLKHLSSGVNRMRLDVEAAKLAAKEEITALEEWNDRIDAKLEKANSDVKRVRTWLDDRRKEKEAHAQEQKLHFEEKLHQTKLDMQAGLTSQQPPQVQALDNSQAKLPKLMITKFDASFMDWRDSGGNFQRLSTIRTYLRELLDSKVRRTIEALPFTHEGYNRAKSILTEKYRKESEIVKAYTREILELPSIPNSNQKKIREFSEKLTYCVQALETLKKLEQVNGAVLMTLDKLPSIRGDLVRTDPHWESWDFVKLSEAIRLWVRRNPVDIAPRNEHIVLAGLIANAVTNAITHRFVTQYTLLATLTTRRQSQEVLPSRQTKSGRICFLSS